MIDSSAFSSLPIAVRDSILQRAFEQLDKRHRFGVAPRVCRLWRQLSLSIITSLEVDISTTEAAEQLTLWMTNHGSVLKSLHFKLDSLGFCVSARNALVQSVGAADLLNSLCISSPFIPVLDIPLKTLTGLTTLRISGFSHGQGALCESITRLTTLRSLSLGNSYTLFTSPSWRPFMRQISSGLTQLTSLEFDNVEVAAKDIAELRALPQLQQLRVVNKPLPASELGVLGPLPITAIHINMNEGTAADVHSWLEHSSAKLQEVRFLVRNSNHMPTPPLAHLQKALQLRELCLYRVQADVTHLTALTQLTRLGLVFCGLDDSVACKLSMLSKLRALSLCGHGITGAQGSMEVLADCMPSLSTLTLSTASALVAARQAFESRAVEIGPWQLDMSL